MEKSQNNAPPPKSSFDGIVGREPASVKDKAKGLISRLKSEKKVKFENIFTGARYKNEVVAIFLAVLELMKLNRIKVYDTDDSIMLELDSNNENFDDDILLENFDGETQANEN